MTIFPIIIDGRPAYLRDASHDLSLAALPYGRTSLFAHVSSRLVEATRRKPQLLRTFDADAAYDRRIAALGEVSGPSWHAADFGQQISSYEPSDWLLLVDLRLIAESGFDPLALFESIGATPRVTRHHVVLESNAAG